MISVRNRQTILPLGENSLYNRTETGIIDGLEVSLTGGRELSVNAGWLRIDGREFDFAGGAVTINNIPSSSDPRFVLLVVTTDGGGGVELDTIVGDPEPLSDDLDTLGGDINQLTTPKPPEMVSGSVPLASVLVLPDEDTINSTHWDDERLAVAPKTTRTITARPGEVQEAFDLLDEYPGGTVELVGGADYRTELGMSDQPWEFQNTNLEGKTAIIGTPSNTEPAIIFDPGFFGGIRNLRIDVPQGHDMESQSDSRGIIDWDLSHFPIDSAFIVNDYSARKYYPRANVIENVGFLGPDVNAVSQQSDFARTPAVRVREAGQGTGVCGLNFHVQGLKNSLHIRSEGAEDANGDRIGFLNGFWGQISSFNCDTDFLIENIDGLGANKHQIEYYTQPNANGSQRLLHLYTESSVANRALQQILLQGHIWDTQKYAQASNGSLMLCDGSEITKNWIWNNSQVSNTSGQAANPVDERNGAGPENGFVDLQDQARSSLKHPEGVAYSGRGAVVGRVDGLGFNAAGDIPPSDYQVPEGVYPAIKGGQLVWGVVAGDGSYREESLSPRKYPGVQSAETLSGLNGSEWMIPVFSGGTGGFQIDIPESHTDFGGVPITFVDMEGACSSNPVTIAQAGTSKGSIQGKTTLDADREWVKFQSNGYQFTQTGGGVPGQ